MQAVISAILRSLTQFERNVEASQKRNAHVSDSGGGVLKTPLKTHALWRARIDCVARHSLNRHTVTSESAVPRKPGPSPALRDCDACSRHAPRERQLIRWFHPILPGALCRKGLFNAVQSAHGVEHPVHRAVGFAPFPDGSNEFAVDQFDPIVGYGDIAEIDRVFPAVK